MQKTVFACLLYLGVLSNAHATPVLWELDGTLLLGQGPATGSFIYDADTMMFSDIMLMTTAAAASGGLTFTRFADDDSNGLIFAPTAIDNVGLILQGVSLVDLTNAGGVLSLQVGGFAEVNCVPDCFNRVSLGGVSNWAGGTLTGTRTQTQAAPEPSTLLLLGLGLLGGYTRRKTA